MSYSIHAALLFILHLSLCCLPSDQLPLLFSCRLLSSFTQPLPSSLSPFILHKFSPWRCTDFYFLFQLDREAMGSCLICALGVPLSWTLYHELLAHLKKFHYISDWDSTAGADEKHCISSLGLLKISVVSQSLESLTVTWAKCREIKRDCESEKNP